MTKRFISEPFYFDGWVATQQKTRVAGRYRRVLAPTSAGGRMAGISSSFQKPVTARF
jgi:hypothetical protein